MEIVLDITELVQNPVRTGIQRVVRELIRHWPDPDRLRLARFDPTSGLRPIPRSVIPLLVESEATLTGLAPGDLAHQIRKRLDDYADPLPNDALTFVPEVFFDRMRCAWYRHILAADRTAAAFLLYDFIPWLFPHRIGVATTAALMPYLQVVRTASRVAFISGQTRSHYFERIKREPKEFGPVLPLGADGLSLPRQSFNAAKKTWVAIGSIDGRKNQVQIVQAFCKLWEQGFEGELVLVGRVFDRTDDEWQKLDVHDFRFRHLQDASDEDVKNELRRARATIYVSDVEGFGLPPVESLRAGIPVIVTRNVPSIRDISECGQVRIQSATISEITDAVIYTANDANAKTLWEEASSQNLSTWIDFSRSASSWLS